MQTTKTKRKRQSSAELVAAIHDRHDRIEHKAYEIIILAKEAGDVLCILKRRVRDEGENWMDWVRTNLKLSYDSVVRYMRIAKRWSRLEEPVRSNPSMKLDDAINLIIEKKRTIPRQPKECDVSRELLRSTFGILISELKDEDVAWLAEPAEDATSRLDAILQQALHERARSFNDQLSFRPDNASDSAYHSEGRPAVFDAQLLRYPLQTRTRLGLDGEDYASTSPTRSGR